MFKELKYYLNKAREEGFALGQFNFCTIEQLKGIISASEETSAPVICGVSPGEADFVGVEEVAALINIMRRKRGVPAFLNLDHGRDLGTVKKAIDLRYDAVHFDGSNLPFEKNVALTKKVVSYAQKRGVLVEGEVGKIEGKSVIGGEKIDQPTLTSMEKIVSFIRQTGVDSIALDIGTLHGVYSSSPEICFERINKTVEETDSFVVMHGGSGVDDEDMREAIKRGVVKVNVNTDLRMVWRSAIYNKMSADPEEITPYNILSFAVKEVCVKTKQKISLFGSKI